MDALGQLCAGKDLADTVVADVGNLGQAIEQTERLQNAGALLHNKVMDSLEESFVIDGLDAQTDAPTLSHDQLARV